MSPVSPDPFCNDAGRRLLVFVVAPGITYHVKKPNTAGHSPK